MNKNIIIALTIIVVVLLGCIIWFGNYFSTNTDLTTDNNNLIVGNDQDVHGCIGSAGYLWCEPKNKCLRIWEEECYASLEQEIQYLLASKYKRSADEVWVSINKQKDNYVSGGVKFGVDDQGAGGLFLAAKIDNIWQIVYDGNGSVDCTKMRQEYMIPDEILKSNFCD